MKHNPLKPDEKLPWCRKCRAHTSWSWYGQGDDEIPRCDRCEGEMLINVASMTHSSRLGCGVRGWPALGMLLIFIGCAIFAGPPGTNSPDSEDPYRPFVAIFFWVCGAGCFAMLVMLYRLRRSWRAWVKEQGGKTDEELEEVTSRFSSLMQELDRLKDLDLDNIIPATIFPEDEQVS